MVDDIEGESEAEVEITPEMVEAGLKAFSRWNPAEDSALLIIEDIYEEMRMAELKASQRAKV